MRKKKKRTILNTCTRRIGADLGRIKIIIIRIRRTNSSLIRSRSRERRHMLIARGMRQ